jgi:predicted metal-dependent peptidase
MMDKEEMLPISYLTAHLPTRFFGILLSMVEMVANDKLPATAGIGIDRDKRIIMMYNPLMMENLEKKERAFVLAHEASHIFCLTTERMGDKDREVWNYATDCLINEMLMADFSKDGSKSSSLSIVEPIREQGKNVLITLKALQEQGLVPKDVNLVETSAEDIYEYMYKKLPKARKPMQAAGCKQGQGQGQGKKGSGKGDKDNPNGQGSGEGEGKEDPLGQYRKIDEHGNIEADDVTEDIKQQIEGMKNAALSDSYGSEAGSFLKKLGGMFKPHFPFKMILQKMFTHTKSDFTHMNRRKQDDVIIYPRRHEVKYKVYATIDVSGSCMDFTEQFLSYVAGLPEFEACYFFDTGITQIWKKGEITPTSTKGYGGTDLNPVMKVFADLEQKNKMYKMNFIVLTDGEIPPLTCGPIKSNVVVFTTHQEVHYSGAMRPYRNIQLPERASRQK